MKIPAAVFTTLIIAACGSPDDDKIGQAGGANDSDVTFCSCANELITTDAKAAACGVGRLFSMIEGSLADGACIYYLT